MSGPAPFPRLPYAPLARYGEPTELGRQLGVHRTAVQHWKKRGVPEDRADEIAVKLGCHPCELWPGWFPE
jgi:hypothetical protein